MTTTIKRVSQVTCNLRLPCCCRSAASDHAVSRRQLTHSPRWVTCPARARKQICATRTQHGNSHFHFWSTHTVTYSSLYWAQITLPSFQNSVTILNVLHLVLVVYVCCCSVGYVGYCPFKRTSEKRKRRKSQRLILSATTINTAVRQTTAFCYWRAHQCSNTLLLYL